MDGEELEALLKIRARYEKNFKTKDVEKVRERKVEKELFTHLPENVIFDILVKVPPKCVYKNARLVCRAWRNMISTDRFIAQNFIETKAELLMQGPTSCSFQYFNIKLMEIEETQLDSKKHDFGLCGTGRVRSSCNGLLLIHHPREKGLLQVMNPATMVGLNLPKSPSGCAHERCRLALGFDPYSKEYKVVHIYNDSFGFEIFNLSCSSSSWKQCPGPWENVVEGRPFDFNEFFCDDPVVVNGNAMFLNVESEKYILSVDVSEEISSRMYLPNIGHEIRKEKYNLVELGEYLSFVYTLSEMQLDVWILEDVKGQVWTKKHSIIANLVDYRIPRKSLPLSNFGINALPNLGKLIPVAGLGDGKLLILCHEIADSVYVYDIQRRLMKKLKKTLKEAIIFMTHKSSLFHWRTLKDP